MTVLTRSETNGFDPARATSSATQDGFLMAAVYDMLLYSDPRSGNILPSTADSLTTSDAKVWTLKIRAGIKFTDGTPYDASAVKVTWDRHADPANASSFASTVKAMKYVVADPLTLTITLDSTSGQFPRLLAKQLPFIASPAALSAGGTNYNNAKPVGAGPFVLKDWVRTSQATLDRNPQYWNAPRPYLDTMIVKAIPDASQRVNAFKSGEAQVVLSDVTTLSNLNGYNTIDSPAISSYAFYFNLQRPFFADANVRKAIQLAVDVAQINKVIFSDQLETPVGYFPKNLPYSDPNLVFPQPDLVKAQQLIDGYISSHGGKDIEFTWRGNMASPAASEEAQLMQAQISRLKGVKMNISLSTATQFSTDLLNSNYDAASVQFIGIDPDPDFINLVTPGNSRNSNKYVNSTVDAAIKSEHETLDVNSRIQSLKTIQQQLLNDMPFFIRWRNPIWWVTQSPIRDLQTFEDGGLLPDRIWLKR